MGISSRHILQQGPVLGALGRTAVLSLQQRFGKPNGQPAAAPAVPGPEFQKTVPPLPQALLDDYVRHVGGDPKSYRGEVPPHLFPQWAFPLAARTLEGLPYPLLRVMNGGCRMEVRAPLPSGQPLQARALLRSIDDDGRRAVLEQHVVTGTAQVPDALISDFYAIVPLPSAEGTKRERKPRPIVPHDVREIARYRLPRDAGLSFAKLTGDFNPIHWLAPYARAFGFPRVILHGFGTFARAAEALTKNLFAGDAHALSVLDAKFTRPLPLPANVGVFVRQNEVFVGDMPGGPAYMTGTFQTRSSR